MEKTKKRRSMVYNIFYFVGLLFKLSPLPVAGQILGGIVAILPTRLISVIGVKYIIDASKSNADPRQVVSAVVLIALILTAAAVSNLLFREFYWNPQKEKLGYRLNKMIFEKAVSLDLEYYDNPEFYNDFIMSIESSSSNIQNILDLVTNFVGHLVTALTISTVIFTIDPVCLAIIIGFIGVFLPISRTVGNLQAQRRIDNAKYHRRSDYFQRIFYLQDYAKEVRMNGIHPLLMSRYNEAADDVVKNQKRYWTKISFFNCVQDIGLHDIGLAIALPLYLGYCVLVRNTLSAGDFMASFNGAYSISMSINFLTIWALARFSEEAKVIDKYRVFLNTKSKIKAEGKEAPVTEPKTIEIKNLSFTYPNNSEPTLKNINMTVKPYEKIALVGYNGAGKTTLTNLLLRLYDATEGGIYIDGENIKDASPASHRNRFAAVFQDFQLFSCTAGENVALDVNPDQGRVKKALAHSGFNRELPNGTDTELLREFSDSGVMLSGGESQKVAVARAFYKNCPYVILDEPSANLDPIAEYQLNQAMIEASEHKTVIFISHRLSTTVNADRIFVMENGEIIESGSHSELMEKNGTYAYMFRLQAEKYSEEKKV